LNRRAPAFAALALAGCLWGTGFPLGKIAIEEMSVGQMVLYRFLFACLALVPVVLRQRIVLPRARDLPLFLIAGALYVPVQFIIQFEGLARTTVSHASLMVGMLPIMLALGAVTFTHERLDLVGWLALAASTAGAALIAAGAAGHAGSGGGPSLLGDLLVLVSLLAAVGWVLVSQRLMQEKGGYPPVIASVVVLVIGTLMLAAWVLVTDGVPPVDFSAKVWLAVAAQGVLATALTTVLWNWGLSRVAAARAGVFVNLEPLVGALLGVTVMHEVLGPTALAGGALIVGAAVAFSARR
jgi:drug/metabolite transporter (DMT)-like permease